MEQEWLLAKHYSLVPLGGFAGWAALGMEGRPRAEAGALAAKNRLGFCHGGCTLSVYQGGVEAATTLEPGSWKLHVWRTEVWFPTMPRLLMVGGGVEIDECGRC